MDNLLKVQELLDELLLKGFEGKYKAEYSPLSENELKIDITGEDVSYLIGQHGKTLLALQHIIRQMYINVSGDYTENLKLIVDVDGYKSKRIERIKELTKGAVEKSIQIGRDVTLPAMTPYERHVVHSYIQENYPDISTESTGEEPNRKVVIKPGTVQL
jgi:spoIIIJ-associated protein